MNFPARILAVFFAFVLIFSFLKPSFAQETTQPDNHYLAPNTDPNVENNLHNWTQSAMIDVMSALSCQLAGVDPTRTDYKCLGVNKETGKIGYVDMHGGLLGLAGNSITYLYTPPIHTSDYFTYLSRNFGIAKPTYAQFDGGFGLESLSPLQDIWVVFRNLVYVIFVIIFAIIGIAIMLRIKIDPRNVMTIQNQIPKIIIGIILVTFSLAIAGFLIDLMYVVTYLITSLIISADHNITISTMNDTINATNPINAVNNIVNHSHNFSGISDVSQAAGNSIGSNLGNLFDNETGRTVAGVVLGLIGFFTGGVGGPVVALAGALLGGFAGALVSPNMIFGPLFSIIAFIIITVAIIASLFRLWFQLILAYISIIVNIIFAPIWIAAGLLPGSKINFSAWLRSMAANLAAFPATLAMLALARVFMDAFGNQNNNFFIPPLIGNPATDKEIGSLIAMGFILSTPHAVKMMKTLFGAPDSGFGSITSGLSSGLGLIQTFTKPIIPRMYYRHRDPYSGEVKTFGYIYRLQQRIQKNYQERTGSKISNAGPIKYAKTSRFARVVNSIKGPKEESHSTPDTYGPTTTTTPTPTTTEPDETRVAPPSAIRDVDEEI